MTTSPPTTRLPWPDRLLALAAATTLLTSLAHPSATRQFTWPWVLGITLLWLVPCVALLHRLTQPAPLNRPGRVLTTSLLGLVAATLLAVVFSPYAAQSFPRIWPTLGGVALFFWLHDRLQQPASGQSNLPTLLAHGLAASGAVLALGSLVGWFWVGGIFNWSYRNEIPFGHSTYVAGALVLVLPWLILATLSARGLARFGWGLGVGIAGLALLVTGSRGGVLAAGLMAMAATGHFVVRTAWSWRTKAAIVAATLGLLALAVLTNPRLRDLVQGRGWSEAARESNAQRSAMLVAGLKLGNARPWTGWGPGTVPLVYPQVRGQLNGGTDNVLQLHNTPAQVWATLGLGGLAALLGLLVAAAQRSAELARQKSFHPVTLTAAFTLLGYGVFALTDHQLDLPFMNAWLVIAAMLFFADDRLRPVGGALRPDPNTASPASTPNQGIPASPRLWRTRKPLLQFGIATFLAALLIPTGRDLAARFSYELGLTAFEHDQPDTGRHWLEKAAAFAPYDPYYRHELTGRLLAQRAQTRDAAEVARLTAAAAEQLQLSLSAGCLQEFAHFNLGWLALEQDRPAAAAEHFLATAREAPHRRGVYWGRGLALLRTGDQPAAIHAFALEWINDPLACTDPVWENPALAPLRAPVARAADALLANRPDLPTAVYLRTWWRWWLDGGALPARGFDRASTELLATLPNVGRRPPAPAEADFAAAIARRAQRHLPGDAHGFLTAGLENEPALHIHERTERFGYGVLARHPDGFMLTDLYARQQNRFVTTYLAPLFPPKGWLPAPQLLKLLDASPAARHQPRTGH